METQTTSAFSEFNFSFPKSKFLFLFAGLVGLYYIAYLSLLINLMCRTGVRYF